MGPLSVKSNIQLDASRLKNQASVIKMLGDEARKKDLHKIKMAKEIAKAEAEGLSLKGVLGASDGTLEVPKSGSDQPATTMKGVLGGSDQPATTLTNPEAGPSDTIPAMLTPGEAVIPASVAQDSAYKPVIEALVNKGRELNRQPGGVKGFADGTTGLTDEERMAYESGGDPLAKNPNSSASGQYQMTTAAYQDVFSAYPEMKGLDFTKPANQKAAYDKFKGEILPNQLRANGVEPTPANIDKAYVVGAGGLKKVSGNPDAPLGASLGERTVAINPNLQGKTGQEFLNDPNPYSRKGGAPINYQESPAPTAVPKPHRRGGTSGFLRDMSQAIPNPVYDAALTEQAKSPDPAVKATAVEEQARLAKARGVPPIQTPDGKQPVPNAGSAPVGVPPPTKSVPKPFISEPNPGEGDPPPTKVSQFESVLNDPQTAFRLMELQEQKIPPGVEPKSWLAKGLEKIFGDTGMFNNEDLIRFSILAAGGLLTGGSVGGSLRYAGLDTLRSSDARRQAMAVSSAKQQEQMRAAQAEQAKNIRERIESLETDFVGKLDKVPPAVQMEAQKLFSASRSAETAGQREAYLTAALRLLGGAKVDDKKDDGDKLNKVEDGYDTLTGKPIKYFTNKKNEFFVFDSEGNPKPAKASSLMSDTQRDKVYKQQEDTTRAMIKERLVDSNRRSDGKPIDETKTDSYFTSKADGMAATFMGLREYFGHNVDPKKFGQIISNTVANMGEELSDSKIKSMSPEALQKLVLGSAVMDSRPSSASYYKAKTESGRPSTAANVMFSGVIEKAKQVGEDPTQFVTRLEEAYKALPDKKKWQSAAEVKVGYSPFLLWVEDTMNK